MVRRIKFIGYCVSITGYCMLVFIAGAALQSAADNIKENASFEARADTYMRQDLVQLVAMKI